MTPERRILRVGLTGNIGAGKSTVGEMLAGHGCLVLDADELARRVLDEDAEAIAAIVGAFGEEVLDERGSIDRRALAARVFGDPEARARLEAITHPRIQRLEADEIGRWSAERGIAVTEAALLVETGGDERYDFLVVVVADDEQRLDRLLERGMDPEDARRRMAAQLPQQEKAEVADWVIDNSGSLERTREQVEELSERLTERLDRG